MDDGVAQGAADVALSSAAASGLPPSRLRQGYAGQAQPSPARGEGFGSGDGGEPDWDEVRRLYELTGTPVSAIQERFGVTPWEFRKARVAGNWTTRPQVARPGALQGHKPIGEESIEFRLNRLIVVGIDVLEKQVADNGFDEERARTLRELCRAQEIRMRSKRTEKAAKAREKKNNDAGQDYRDDPEWLLAEINRKLGRLAARDEARGGAEGAGGDDPGGTRGGDA
jgi:hypothetical protein